MDNNQCDNTETTFHVLLKCNKFRVWGKIIENVFYNYFQEQINMNEKALIIGYLFEGKVNFVITFHVNFRPIHSIYNLYPTLV